MLWIHALSGGVSLRRAEVQSQRDSYRPRIAREPDVESRVPRRGSEELKVIPVEEVARPDEQLPAVVPTEARSCIHETIAVHHKVCRRRRTGRKFGTIAGVKRTEELARLGEEGDRPTDLAAEGQRPRRDAGENRARDILDLGPAGVLE